MKSYSSSLNALLISAVIVACLRSDDQNTQPAAMMHSKRGSRRKWLGRELAEN